MKDAPALTFMSDDPSMVHLGPSLHLEIRLHPLQLGQQHVPVRDWSSRFDMGMKVLMMGISILTKKEVGKSVLHHFGC